MEKSIRIGSHSGYGLTSGDGTYEATVGENGDVLIETVFDIGGQRPKVHLRKEEWDALSTWVAYRNASIKMKSG